MPDNPNWNYNPMGGGRRGIDPTIPRDGDVKPQIPGTTDEKPPAQPTRVRPMIDLSHIGDGGDGSGDGSGDGDGKGAPSQPSPKSPTKPAQDEGEGKPESKPEPKVRPDRQGPVPRGATP